MPKSRFRAIRSRINQTIRPKNNIKRIMSAITIQAITILENKEDDTLMAKEEFFKMIDEARASKKTKASKQELINMLYK